MVTGCLTNKEIRPDEEGGWSLHLRARARPCQADALFLLFWIFKMVTELYKKKAPNLMLVVNEAWAHSLKFLSRNFVTMSKKWSIVSWLGYSDQQGTGRALLLALVQGQPTGHQHCGTFFDKLGDA